MNCPVCKNIVLVLHERQGVEIDYCPECRGVWLDRGELDKIIERSTPTAVAPTADVSRRNESDRGYAHNSKHSGDYAQQGYSGHYKKKKSSFLGDLFDF